MRVEVNVGRAAFADTLGSMRQFLDANGSPEVRFETTAVGENILITIEISSDELATSFQSHFNAVLRDAA